MKWHFRIKSHDSNSFPFLFSLAFVFFFFFGNRYLRTYVYYMCKYAVSALKSVFLARKKPGPGLRQQKTPLNKSRHYFQLSSVTNIPYYYCCWTHCKERPKRLSKKQDTFAIKLSMFVKRSFIVCYHSLYALTHLLSFFPMYSYIIWKITRKAVLLSNRGKKVWLIESMRTQGDICQCHAS